MGDKKSSFPWLIIITFGLSLLIKWAITLWGLSRSDWDLDAPVTYRVFGAILLVETLAILYLLAKVLWLGTPALLQ